MEAERNEICVQPKPALKFRCIYYTFFHFSSWNEACTQTKSILKFRCINYTLSPFLSMKTQTNEVCRQIKSILKFRCINHTFVFIILNKNKEKLSQWTTQYSNKV